MNSSRSQSSGYPRPGWIFFIIVLVLLCGIFVLLGLTYGQAHKAAHEADKAADKDLVCPPPPSCTLLYQSSFPIVLSGDHCYTLMEDVVLTGLTQGTEVEAALFARKGVSDVNLNGFSVRCPRNKHCFVAYGEDAILNVRKGDMYQDEWCTSSACRGITFFWGAGGGVADVKMERFWRAITSLNSSDLHIRNNIFPDFIQVGTPDCQDAMVLFGREGSVMTITNNVVKTVMISEEIDPELNWPSCHGIYLASYPSQNSGRCAIMHVDGNYAASHTPLTMDCTGAGSTLTNHHSHMLTSYEAVCTASQIHIFDPFQNSFLTIDGLTVTGETLWGDTDRVNIGGRSSSAFGTRGWGQIQARNVHISANVETGFYVLETDREELKSYSERRSGSVTLEDFTITAPTNRFGMFVYSQAGYLGEKLDNGIIVTLRDGTFLSEDGAHGLVVAGESNHTTVENVNFRGGFRGIRIGTAVEDDYTYDFGDLPVSGTIIKNCMFYNICTAISVGPNAEATTIVKSYANRVNTKLDDSGIDTQQHEYVLLSSNGPDEVTCSPALPVFPVSLETDDEDAGLIPFAPAFRRCYEDDCE